MIISSHTIVNPRAMMVKAFDALLADVAVPTPDRSDCLTLWAQLGGIELLKELNEVHSVFYVTRVFGCTDY
jgi:hypothetical protein